MERASSGVEGLDQILCGGFVRGSAYVLEGPPGAGKTILANQFCFRQAADGGSAVYVSLLAESHHRMIEHMSEFSFFDASLIPEKVTYLSASSNLTTDGLGGVLRLVREETRRMGATAVILDGVFIARNIASTEHEYQRFIYELQGIAGSQRSVMLLIAHPRQNAELFDYPMVDGSISLHQDLAGVVTNRSLQIGKQRGSNILAGRHAFTLSRHGFRAFPRLESTLGGIPGDDIANTRLSLGLPSLDRMLAGGLPERSATIIMGPTGSGKTTLGLHFLARASDANRSLFMSFYETPARLQAKAAEIGMDFSGLVATGALQILWQPPSEIIPDEIAHQLLDQVQRRRVTRVFIDGIVPLRDSLLPQSRLPGFVNALNSHLRDLGVTVVYSSELRHVTMPEELPSDEISAMIDNLVILTYSQQNGLLQRRVSILKLRDSAFDARAHEIHLGASGLSFEPVTQLPGNLNAGS
ncbi:MAG TPA: ATPase domain-containing protein [Terriglobia bacterium]|nr:ATPase domain-containing protein [Terriglobia bacterium]